MAAITRAEIETQWQNAVDILEKTRVFADGTVGIDNELDTLYSSLRGDVTPDRLSAAGEEYRRGLSDLLDPSRVRDFLDPILREYANRIITTFGAGYETLDNLMTALL